MEEHNRTARDVIVSGEAYSIKDDCANMMEKHLFIVIRSFLKNDMMEKIHKMVSHC